MRRLYLIMLGVVVLAIVAAGSAVAATKFESPSTQSNAIINDAANRLHVTPGALSSALKQALDDQIDAAVAAGRLTKQQGDALKARVDKGQTPLVPGAGFGFVHRLGRGFGFGNRGHGFGAGPPWGMYGADFKTVTSYLGISEPQLHSALRSGKSLAQIAIEHGKTADGLVAALAAAAKTKLDQAVGTNHLTAAQEKAILSKLPTFLSNLVNRTTPAFGDQRLPGFGFGFGFRTHGRGRALPPGANSHAWLRPDERRV